MLTLCATTQQLVAQVHYVSLITHRPSVAAAFVREVAAVFRLDIVSLRFTQSENKPARLKRSRRNIPRMQKDFFAARDDGLSLADDLHRMNDEQRAVRVLLRMFHLLGRHRNRVPDILCALHLDMKRNAGHVAQKIVGFRLVLVLWLVS